MAAALWPDRWIRRAVTRHTTATTREGVLSREDQCGLDGTPFSTRSDFFRAYETAARQSPEASPPVMSMPATPPGKACACSEGEISGYLSIFLAVISLGRRGDRQLPRSRNTSRPRSFAPNWLCRSRSLTLCASRLPDPRLRFRRFAQLAAETEEAIDNSRSSPGHLSARDRHSNDLCATDQMDRIRPEHLRVRESQACHWLSSRHASTRSRADRSSAIERRSVARMLFAQAVSFRPSSIASGRVDIDDSAMFDDGDAIA